MRKSKADTLAALAALEQLAIEMQEQRALLLGVSVKVDNIGRMLDTPVVSRSVPEKASQDGWMTVAEAADWLKVSKFTVRDACVNGRLTANKVSNHIGWRIDPESVQAEWDRRHG